MTAAAHIIAAAERRAMTPADRAAEVARIIAERNQRMAEFSNAESECNITKEPKT